MSNTHIRSAREHLAQADALAAETDEIVEELRDEETDPHEAVSILQVLAMTIGRGNLHAKLAEVHIALAGCPVD